MRHILGNDDILGIIFPALFILFVLFAFYVTSGKKSQRLQQRIARATRRKGASIHRKLDAVSLRKAQENGLPLIGKLLQNISFMASLRARLERAGFELAPDIYTACCASITFVVAMLLFLLNKRLMVAVIIGFFVGTLLPYLVIGYLGSKRIRKFLTLFPDAIDFIVRGLRSGLPVAESMNMVGEEMEEPVGSIFAGVGESVRLGVSLEKALWDTSIKLKSTEFNFFVTSIVLQRETGGNLSEILNNLAEVLRKRFMMRMKIKAMSSEAKASAIIVGSLPFFVIIVLLIMSPDYLDPFIDYTSGNIAAGCAMASLAVGIGIMIKMTRFEI